MKKIFATFVIMMILSVNSFAETDLNSLSLEELIVLRDNVIVEICDRVSNGHTNSVMYNGKFVVGEDIKPGYYLFTAADEDETFAAFTYPDTNMTWGEDTLFQAEFGKSFTIDLKDGMVLETTRGYAFVEIINKPDWAM